MAERQIAGGALVLYKNRAALVLKPGEKPEIRTAEGANKKVRHKDLHLLHPGPLDALSELQALDGDVYAAWELLQETGSSTLEEVSELVYGSFTPQSAWAAWQLLADGLYFTGNADTVLVRSADEYAQECAARQRKQAENDAWRAFVDRIESEALLEEDRAAMREVEAVAYGTSQTSRILKELGRAVTPESAHALLLRLGVWDESVNPYPQRFEIATSIPSCELPEADMVERLDLRHLPAYAIDDEGNQDPDDALSIEGDTLWVHVADCSALVPPDSNADLHARNVGASLYLPEGTIPMLPPQATALLGLGLREVSPAMSFAMTFDGAAALTDVRVHLSNVRVQRLSYAEAERRLDEADFARLNVLAQKLKQRREERGAVSIDLPEAKVQVHDGKVEVIPLVKLRSREIVAEAMLIAGAAAARFARANAIPLPFTTQAAPENADPPHTPAEQFAFRKGMKPSRTQSEPEVHAGLGLEMYARATSPLRRYLDLVVHQQLRAFLCGRNMLSAEEVLERVGAAEAIVGAVRRAERLSIKHWLIVYLQARPEWSGRAVVVEKRGRRATVLLPELACDAPLLLEEDVEIDTEIAVAVADLNLPELHFSFRMLRK